MSHVLHLGDCMDGLAALPDRSVDVYLMDPPYSANLYLRTRTNAGARTDAAVRGKEFAASRLLNDRRIGAVDDILDGVATQMLRTARRWVIVFSDIEIAPRWRAAFGDWYVRTGVWVKTDPTPQITGDRPAQGFEACTIAHRPGRKRWNGGGRPAVWIEGTAKGSERPEHPCPKPLDLMLRLVADFTDPGELVCDPFAGSGTTLVACKRLGRNAIGWEKDPKFHAAALKRIEGTREQMEFAGPRPRRPRQLPLRGPGKDEEVAR